MSEVARPLNLSGGAWCVYIGQKGHANFMLGRTAKTWGMDRRKKLKGVKKGDRIIFVENVDGWNRYSREEFPNRIGAASAIVECITTSDIYEDSSPLWPDGAYSFRFSFAEIGELNGVHLKDVATSEVIEAIRLSGINQGEACFASHALPSATSAIELTNEGAATLDELASATFMERSDLQELEALLQEKKQIVLEGPPGSGKTYLADKFARYFTGNPLEGDADDKLEIVQFHQSFGYEDFVQGIRPFTGKAGTLGYQVKSGIFMDFCKRAGSDPENHYVIIIDEINRGNISRIFGELLLLLEYRKKRVRLPYGADDKDVDSSPDERFFTIPENVFIIGTMNSTDRSLALIDYALRRRFYFYRLLPTMNGRAPVFESWLDRKEMEETDRRRLLNLFLQLNRKILDHLPEDFQIGHSYFMVDNIESTEKLELVWRRAVTPLLVEYFHTSRDSAEILSNFTITSLSGPPTDHSEAGILDG